MEAEFVNQSQEGFGEGTTLIKSALHRMPDISDGSLFVCVEAPLALSGRLYLLVCCLVAKFYALHETHGSKKVKVKILSCQFCCKEAVHFRPMYVVQICRPSA